MGTDPAKDDGRTVSRDPKDRGDKSDVTVQFMLADLGVLKDFRQDLIQQGETRINFYMTVVSVSFVGIGVVNQGFDFNIAFIVSGFVLSGLIAMGIMTFVRMVERSIGIVLYTRRINRVRRYFLDRDASVGSYMSFLSYDDQPHFRRMGFLRRGSDSFGLPELVAVINSIVVSSGIAVAFAQVGQFGLFLPGTIGVGTFLLTLFLHVGYHNRRIALAEVSAVANFPSPKPSVSTTANSMSE